MASSIFGIIFGRFSIQILGVIYANLILPPKFESKIGQINPKIDRSLIQNQSLSSFFYSEVYLDFFGIFHIRIEL